MSRIRLLLIAGLALASSAAVAQVPVADSARQGKEKSIADCFTASKTYKKAQEQPQGDIQKSVASPGQGAMPVAAGKDVVVIGGGDTAMDCVRTAIRQGAKSVSCLYRRDKANMPGSMREVKNAEEEGVRFEWLAAPEAFLGDAAVSGVRAQRMHLGLPDASGRQQVEPIPGASFTLNADLVIKALGFDPEDLPAAFNEPELPVTRWGTLKVDHRTMMTTLPGVFAAGDIVRGASLVVWGIRDGRDVAEQIHAFIQARGAAPAMAAE